MSDESQFTKEDIKKELKSYGLAIESEDEEQMVFSFNPKKQFPFLENETDINKIEVIFNLPEIDILKDFYNKTYEEFYNCGFIHEDTLEIAVRFYSGTHKNLRDILDKKKIRLKKSKKRANYPHAELSRASIQFLLYLLSKEKFKKRVLFALCNNVIWGDKPKDEPQLTFSKFSKLSSIYKGRFIILDNFLLE